MAPIDGGDWRDNEGERRNLVGVCFTRLEPGKKSGQLNEDMGLDGGLDGAGGVGR